MGATMKTIEEWISKVRAEYNLRECNENELSFEDDLQRATKIIEHLLGAVRFYSNKNNYEDQKHPHYGEISSAIAWDMAGKTARDAIAAAEKEIGG